MYFFENAQLGHRVSEDEAEHRLIHIWELEALLLLHPDGEGAVWVPLEVGALVCGYVISLD